MYVVCVGYAQTKACQKGEKHERTFASLLLLLWTHMAKVSGQTILAGVVCGITSCRRSHEAAQVRF